MRKLITLTFVMTFIALSMMVIPEKAQAVVFIPDDCVENGTPQQRANCLWYMHIAIMHDNGFVSSVEPPNPEEVLENAVAEPVPVYAVKSEHVIIWHPLRS